MTPRLSLIVSSGVLNNSSAVFGVLDPDSGGASTFSVPLSADGQAPATHFGTYTMLEDETHDALVGMNTIEFLAYVNLLAMERGRAGLQSSVAFKNSLQIEDINNRVGFWAFIQSRGLQVVQVDI